MAACAIDVSQGCLDCHARSIGTFADLMHRLKDPCKEFALPTKHAQYANDVMWLLAASAQGELDQP